MNNRVAGSWQRLKPERGHLVADMVAALTKSTEVIAHNSAMIEQIQRKLMA